MKKFLLQVLIFCLVAFQIWNIVILLNPTVKTEMVRYDTIENAGEYTGMIVRNETVIPADAPGALESIVSENEVVKRGKMVASVYTGDVDKAIQEKLKQVNARIAEITGAQENSLVFEGDQTKIENNISSRVSDIIVSINDKDIRRISELKGDLNVLIGKKMEVSGESGSVATMLDQLESQKSQYEQSLSAAKQNLFAPVAGIYSTNIDGFEQVLSGESLLSMNVGDFKALNEKEPQADEGAGQTVCKIVDNMEWYAAVLMDENKASEIKAGQGVYIKLGENPREYNATVSYVSPADDKKCVVAVTVTEYSEDALKHRKTPITLATHKYSGIKVPIKAIRVNNGQQGVYTVTEGLMKFKKADIIYKDDRYAIVKENNSDSSSLLLYDEVVVDAKEVGENISIR